MTGNAHLRRLDGWRAVVAGGGGTIDTAVSVQLAQRSRDTAERVVDRIADIGGDARVVRTGLADERGDIDAE